MRLLWLAGLAGILVVVATARPDAVGAIYQQIYPSDPALRRALDQCSLENRAFDRLDPAAREACYRHNPAHYKSAAAAGPEPRVTAAPNFVDQWRAAGQGRLPHNDIRAEQRGERYLGTAAAGASR
jgi:hypothetical protein